MRLLDSFDMMRSTQKKRISKDSHERSFMATLSIHRMGTKSGGDVWEYSERQDAASPMPKPKKTTSFKKLANVIEDASGRGVKIRFTGRGITF